MRRRRLREYDLYFPLIPPHRRQHIQLYYFRYSNLKERYMSDYFRV
jgi:hypothetical protein